MRTYFVIDCTSLATVRRLSDISTDGEALAVFQAMLPELKSASTPYRLVCEDRTVREDGIRLVTATRRIADAYGQRTLTATVRELLGLPSDGHRLSLHA